MKYVRLSVVPAIVVWLVGAGAAFAGNSTLKSGYSTTPKNVAAVVATKPPSIKHTVQSGTLPFTGVNLGLFVAAAVALIVVGLVFRRLARTPS
jgi:hypothetical protein